MGHFAFFDVAVSARYLSGWQGTEMKLSLISPRLRAARFTQSKLRRCGQPQARLAAGRRCEILREDLSGRAPSGWRSSENSRVSVRDVRFLMCGVLCLATATPALAGPPYLTDDPEPTDYQHFEIYAFTQGQSVQGDTGGQSGIDFNYGGAPNLQLTATVPVDYDLPSGAPAESGLGNIELAAKYLFLTQQNFGLDVAIFPRIFFPAVSPNVGDRHASLLLPIWVEKDWGNWSAFGGGGCELNRGGNSQDFCQAGLAVTNQLRTDLQVGVELFHQTADTIGSEDTTSVGTGVRYDLNDHLHVLGYLGRGIENANTTDRVDWYTSILFTF